MNLKGKRVLVSNDDGINAPGLKVLEKAVKGLGAEVWVSAPETEQSATGHSLTIRRPLRIRKVSGKRYAVDGTPTDAVLLGMKQVMTDRQPDLVVSGINRGGNLGEDVTYSGTVAAAMEGRLLGVPAIAFSLVYDDAIGPRWSTAEHWIGPVLEKIAGFDVPTSVLLNVNFPDVAPTEVTGIEATRQGYRKIGGDIREAHDPRGLPYYWIGAQRVEDRFAEGTDLEAVHRGAISITPLSLDFTHKGTAKKLKKALKERS
ncbi:MAG: 5'/3'-nucleotidase SurE [Magnetovibrionaceae bacterium]